MISTRCSDVVNEPPTLSFDVPFQCKHIPIKHPERKLENEVLSSKESPAQIRACKLETDHKYNMRAVYKINHEVMVDILDASTKERTNKKKQPTDANRPTLCKRSQATSNDSLPSK
jgi:hypothetical protein